MDFLQAIRPECLKVQAVIGSSQELLECIARLAAGQPGLGGLSEEALATALAAREEMGSTGFGDGIAIPHCRLPEVTEFCVGAVTIPNGVEFSALDDKPVHLAVFIIAPDTASNEHIHLLSALSRMLGQPAVVRELLAADTTEALYESMQRHLADREAPEGAQRECNLLTVVTDNTDLVTPVLQALVSLKGVDTVVLDGKQASAHLRRVPMFSSFWSDCGDDTIKVIQAVVPRGLCNEAVRRIGNDVGDLTGHRDLLVTVQELAYCVGSLSK